LEDTHVSTNGDHSLSSPSHINDLEVTFDENLQEEDEATESHGLLSSHSLRPSLPSSSTSIPYSSDSPSHQRSVSTNDGVFANMSAKPESGKEKKEETPPVSVNIPSSN
jgi:hypothetical protein